MAHQAHQIPWTLLASNLHWRPSNPCLLGANNFHFRFKSGQGKQITYFVTALVRSIQDHASCERRKYPEEYDPPDPDDIVLSDAVAEKIGVTVNRWRDEEEPSAYPMFPQNRQDRQSNLLSYQERTMNTFIQRYITTPCPDFLDFNYKSFFGVEIVKTLLLYGEMATILRICAHQDVELAAWLSPSCRCGGGVIGWEWICRFALDAYILLNLIHCFPDMWYYPNPEPLRLNDYRHTKAYQYMVHRVTGAGRASEVTMYPHRQFFGIANDHFRGASSATYSGMWPRARLEEQDRRGMLPYGRMSFEHFLRCGNPPASSRHQNYLPSASDVSHVRWVLSQKNLPVEITELILQAASYTTQRRLPVAHHPFHPSNRTELAKYLRYCWQLIVRCEVMGRALGTTIPWENMVGLSIGELFNCNCGSSKSPRLFEWDYVKSDEGILRFC